MAKFKLTSEIVDSQTKVWYNWDGFDCVCSDDVVNFIEQLAEDDRQIDLQINCAGGIVSEGWRMYDALRQSGRTITATIEGDCSSMATVVLMAAPKENRKAYQHARMCIHNPEACWLDADLYNRLTADNLDKVAVQVQEQAARLREEQQKILDVYVERTGADAATLQALMDEDKYINMSKAIELGFISSTLAPNTASKGNHYYNKNNMNKSKAQVQVEEGWLNRLLNKAGFKSKDEAQFKNLKVTAADGSELEVEREEGDPQVGDAASPDGTFTLEDGTVITVADGVITAIDAPQQSKAITDPETGEELTEEAAQQRLSDLFNRVKELEEQLNGAQSANTDLKTNLDTANATITTLTNEKAQAEQKVVDLTAKLPNEEQLAILDIVAKAGGKEWLDRVGQLQSKGDPNKPQAQFKGGDNEHKLGEGFLADQKKTFRLRR